MAAIAFQALGSLGDINPLLGIARALHQRGHEVTFITSPYYEDFVASAGVPFVPIGTKEQLDAQISNPNLWHPLKFIDVSFSAALEWLPAGFQTIETLARRGLDVIAAQFQCFGARIGAEVFGVPMATVLPCPVYLQSRYDPVHYPMFDWMAGGNPLLARTQYAIANTMLARTVGPRLNRFRKSIGLKPAPSIIDWLWSTDLHLAVWPEWMRAPQADTAPQLKVTGFVEFDSEPITGQVPLDAAFLARKPIVFTPGSAMKFGRSFFAAAADAMKAMPDRAAYFVTRYADEQLPATLPDNVRHLPFAPFGTLLPHCSAVVHHGGPGTAGRAMRAGLPQVIIPYAFDQYDNGHIVRRLGVGDRILHKDLSGAVLARKLRELLGSPTVQAACADRADALAREDSLGKACAAIEALVAPGRPAVVGRPAVFGKPSPRTVTASTV